MAARTRARGSLATLSQLTLTEDVRHVLVRGYEDDKLARREYPDALYVSEHVVEIARNVVW